MRPVLHERLDCKSCGPRGQLLLFQEGGDVVIGGEQTDDLGAQLGIVSRCLVEKGLALGAAVVRRRTEDLGDPAQLVVPKA